MVTKWVIRYRGKITRDVGTEVLEEPSAEMARDKFLDLYPLREVLEVYRESLG